MSKLIVEDVAPEYSREVVNTGFPEYIAAMKAVEFGDAKTASEMRMDVGAQLESMFPVCVLQSTCYAF